MVVGEKGSPTSHRLCKGAGREGPVDTTEAAFMYVGPVIVGKPNIALTLAADARRREALGATDEMGPICDSHAEILLAFASSRWTLSSMRG